MNKEHCPFLTGNERMDLVISESYLINILSDQFDKNSDQPYLLIHEDREYDGRDRSKSLTKKNNIKKSTEAAAELAFHFLDDLGCIVCN